MSAALHMGGDSLSSRVCAVIRERYAKLKNGSQIVARLAHSTPRTAENWFADECAPRSGQLLQMMCADPEFEAAVIEIVRARRAEGSRR